MGMIKLKTILTEIEPDYRGLHRAPDNDGYNAPLYSASSSIYPDDIYSNKAAQFYGDRSTSYSDQETISIIQSSRDKPETQIKIYRAVPKTVSPGSPINPGDWVTINKRYAIQHGESNLYGDYNILTKTVPAKYLYTDGNSIHEWGYDPS
jgi:hypothetical protein